MRRLFDLILIAALTIVVPASAQERKEMAKELDPIKDSPKKDWVYTANEKISLPFVNSGHCYVATSKAITSLDITSGHIVQSFERKDTDADEILSTIAVYNHRLLLWTICGKDLNRAVLRCYDMKLQKELWRSTVRFAGMTYGAFPSALPSMGPTLWENRVYIPEGRSMKPGPSLGGIVCLDINDGKQIWKSRKFGIVIASPVVHDGLVIATAGCPMNQTMCFDARTGKEEWRYAAGHSENSVTVLGNKLFLYSTELHCLDPASGKEQELPSIGFKMKGTIQATLAQDNERLYVRGLNTMYCFSKAATKDALLWKKTMKKAFSAPAIAKNRIYVANQNGNLYCLDAGSGNESWKYHIGSLLLAGMERGSFFADDNKSQIIVSSPVLAKGRILITSGKRLVCLDTGDPSVDGWFCLDGNPARTGVNQERHN